MKKKPLISIFFFVSLLFFLLAVVVIRLGKVPGRELFGHLVQPITGEDVKDTLLAKLSADDLAPAGPIEENESGYSASISGITVLFPKKGDLERKLWALQMIWNRFTMEGRRPSQIDLRFDKPIVRY